MFTQEFAQYNLRIYDLFHSTIEEDSAWNRSTQVIREKHPH